MLHATPPGPRSNLNRAEAGQDVGASYKIKVSATREVCQVVLPGHLQPCTSTHYTERGNIIIDRICLAWYRLMLAIAGAASMLCGSPQKTGLLSGQRRRMLASHRTDLRLMGLDIATTRDFPARIESGRGVFCHVFIGIGTHRGVCEILR